MIQLKKFWANTTEFYFRLPARWDCVFFGDRQQIIIIVWNMYVMLIIEVLFVGNKAKIC